MPRPLGQHFLNDPAILDRIAAAIDPDPRDTVLEIGPGGGTLTRRLAARVGRVVAIEKDRRLVQALRDGEPPLPTNVTVIEGDALAVDWREVGEVGAVTGGEEEAGAAEAEAVERVPPVDRPSAIGHRLKVVGNIPYYITSPLIEKALQPPAPTVVVYLVQKEVADRVVAAPGSRTYGALSVGVQAVAHAERLFVVRAGAFRPPPAVDSAVLRLRPRGAPLVTADEREGFRQFVVGLFGQRRKQITGGLRTVAALSRDASLDVCARAGIDPQARPESLSPDRFVTLYRTVRR